MLKRLLPIFLIFAVNFYVSYSQEFINPVSYQEKTSSKFDIENLDLSLKLKNSSDSKYPSAVSSVNDRKTGLNPFKKISASGIGSFKLKEKVTKSGKKYIDVYFHNFYDSYQENYIANFIGHLHFGVGPGFFVGPYLDVYADSKSSKALIYNDRFVELGFFLRYYFFKNLYFEGRIGYTRQIDLDSNKINFKPMLVYFYRFGEPVFKRTKSSDPNTSLYLDIYYAAMYDYKYKNAFLQGILTQALRFSMKGYSYFENYLFQSGQFDGRKVDYNNYFEIGTGIRFKPNMLVGPVIFVEPTYKVYFFGEKKNSFQVKAGFILNFFLEM